MSIFTTFKIINVTLALIGIFAWLLYYCRYKEPVAIAPVTWLLNLLFYNVFLVFMSHTAEVMNLANVWSSGLRTHAAILLIAAVLIMFPRRAKKGD